MPDALFRRLCGEGDAPLSIHFMESPAEEALYRGEGELAAWYAVRGWSCDFLHYGSPVERLVACVPPTRSVLLVHNCCVTQRTIDRVMAHFTAPVWWCLCPGSNRYISGARPPVELLRANGLNLCVGTDSLASNGALSLVDELRLLGEGIPLAERLLWATAGGAAALGLGDTLGTIARGRRRGWCCSAEPICARCGCSPNRARCGWREPACHVSIFRDSSPPDDDPKAVIPLFRRLAAERVAVSYELSYAKGSKKESSGREIRYSVKK